MNADYVLKQTGAITKGHFTYTSGRHGDTYIEKCRLLESPFWAEMLCSQIVYFFRDKHKQPDIVIGPTTGGILVAYEVARQFNEDHVRTIAQFAESGHHGRYLGRGFAINPGDKVLVVDDILTTGESVRDVIKVVEVEDGNVIGIGVLVDRTNGAVSFGDIDTIAALTIDINSYEAEKCPMCNPLNT